METTRYTLETVTPLFLRGPDGETPELRPPSFKGQIRYWWRALHPQPVDRLRSEEARRFGSAGDNEEGRSPVWLRIKGRDLTDDWYKPVPRPEKNFKNRGFDPGQVFDLIVTLDAWGEQWSDEIDATLRLMLLLGGVGNRSRRGFGSLRLKAVDGSRQAFSDDPLEDVMDQLTRLDTQFERDGRTISYSGRHADQDGPGYPWIRRIEVGKFCNGWRPAVQSIAEIAHQHCSSYTGDYKPRLSSPLYVTVGSDDRWYWPLVTSLNVPDSTIRKISRDEEDTRDEFRQALL